MESFFCRVFKRGWRFPLSRLGRVGMLGLWGLLVSAMAVTAQQASDAIPPEMLSDLSGAPRDPDLVSSWRAKQAGQPVKARDWMIVAAHPLAVAAGADVLAAGGTAADAMVTAQAVLGLVEPQSSGLGGGGFLLYFDNNLGEVFTLDGRETAPSDATPRLLQDENGKPLKFFDAVVGGLAVGVPGTPALMAGAHQRWGTKDWAGLLAPASDLARQGFPVSPRLAAMVARDAERLSSYWSTAAYFLPDGQPIQSGQVLKNPAYAETLDRMAKDGADGFYDGETAEVMIDAVAMADRPGLMWSGDLANYTIKERDAVCAPYRGFEVCGMGPPSSGGVAVAQMLGLIEAYGAGPDAAGGTADASSAKNDSDSEPQWNTLTLRGNAGRMVFADRGRYLADSDFVPVPVNGLIDPEYLTARAQELTDKLALGKIAPGRPKFDHAMIQANHEGRALPSTTHLSIVDSYGNALSLTSSIENAFGSRIMVGGFLLNNQLTDFSFRSHKDGVPIANRVEPGKRPRSSMAPTIVLRDGRPVLIAGSPGGSRIIPFVANAVQMVLDGQGDVQQAVSAPHILNRFGIMEFEAGRNLDAAVQAMEERGFKTRVAPMASGLHMIAITPDGLMGGADPRREGLAYGR
jgi:gamma-glutamyltranspeptidase/glutathione hydrolase